MLKESNKANIKVPLLESPQVEKKVVEQLRIPSPYDDLEKSDSCYSPEKF